MHEVAGAYTICVVHRQQLFVIKLDEFALLAETGVTDNQAQGQSARTLDQVLHIFQAAQITAHSVDRHLVSRAQLVRQRVECRLVACGNEQVEPSGSEQAGKLLANSR